MRAHTLQFNSLRCIPFRSVSLHTYTHTHIHVHTYTPTQRTIQTSMHTYVHAHRHTYIRTTYILIYRHTYTHRHTHFFRYIHVCNTHTTHILGLASINKLHAFFTRARRGCTGLPTRQYLPEFCGPFTINFVGYLPPILLVIYHQFGW